MLVCHLNAEEGTDSSRNSEFQKFCLKNFHSLKTVAASKSHFRSTTKTTLLREGGGLDAHTPEAYIPPIGVTHNVEIIESTDRIRLAVIFIFLKRKSAHSLAQSLSHDLVEFSFFFKKKFQTMKFV